MPYPVCTDVIRRIQDETGTTLDVRPSPDAPEFGVSLCTSDKDGEEYWGKVNLVFEPEFAIELGNALIMCAQEVMGKRR